jgi:NTE family protein
MGAIIGGLYACGMSSEELTRFALEQFDIAKYLDSFVFKINGPFGKVFQTGQILGSLATGRGIDSGKRILTLLEELSGGKTFAETRFPFRCNAVDLVGGRELVFSTGSVAHAIRASMSFPGFFEPLIDGKQCLADGGIADNMPVHIAWEEGFTRILAINVYSFKPVPISSLKTGPKIVYRSLEVAQHSMDHKSGRDAELTIYAGDDTSAFNFFRKKELITVGERAVEKHEEQLKTFFSSGLRAAFTRKQLLRRSMSAERG